MAGCGLAGCGLAGCGLAGCGLGALGLGALGLGALGLGALGLASWDWGALVAVAAAAEPEEAGAVGSSTWVALPLAWWSEAAAAPGDRACSAERAPTGVGEEAPCNLNVVGLGAVCAAPPSLFCASKTSSDTPRTRKETPSSKRAGKPRALSAASGWLPAGDVTAVAGALTLESYKTVASSSSGSTRGSPRKVPRGGGIPALLGVLFSQRFTSSRCAAISEP